MRVGIEVGGTFTDLVAVEGGEVRIAKVPSVPARPDEGAMAVLKAAGLAMEDIDDLVHGSTVAINAVLERKGAKTAFLVTKGFRDLLALQRHNRRQIYDLFYAKPVPVVGQRDTFEIDERTGPDGGIVKALDTQALDGALAQALGCGGYEAVAVCLLNGYANPAHEQAVAAWLKAHFPDLAVTCSSDVTREFREYERASTTTIAAYVQPVNKAYIDRLADSLRAAGFTGRFSIMQSNGGRLPAAASAGNAVGALFSGPAAGVKGAIRQAALAGYRDIVTLDMGGTSTDVCLVNDAQADLTSETEVDGLPIRVPALDIVSVGAGGGSIVWIDDGGMLRVGPRSAGASPGPACYERGGVEATVTDAHMIRGAIRAQAFLGGAMRVDRDAAARAFEPLARHFDMSLEDIADSAVRVADANIVRAIELVSTERGRDPRDYVLVPYGGAGPLHAVRVAEALGIATIVVPPNAGVLSAFGLLAADFAQYDTMTRRVAVDAQAPGRVRKIYAEMAARARAAFAAAGIDAEPAITFTLEMRYVGQAFEVQVPLESEALEGLRADDLAARFADVHIQGYGFGGADYGACEIMSFRVGALAPPGELPALREAEPSQTGAACKIFDGGEWRCGALAQRAGIRNAGGQPGPALVEDATSTAFIPGGWHATIDLHDNLVIERLDLP
ncbi:MAG: Acetophenone carboxylase gamma subunit [Alphaproteobacteria bacterium MarineAlpha10_Bin3]|jgi:N-methylhydantoinase A|nr:MAG: Acetophenone carboxylase gamma subunit [Alphaproteobacteria bacterium MarineAlpha10_Bin3]PPR73855.1 MAG: Acetophenone carboxylase gamma subunit [Alphaproteobacteria bacterium MarineAlpha4_Bin1]